MKKRRELMKPVRIIEDEYYALPNLKSNSSVNTSRLTFKSN